MRVVFAGTPEVAVPALRAIAASRHQLVGVVTRPDAPSGRGRRLTPSPVALAAAEFDVPILKPAHPRDPAFQDDLSALAPECCPVVAYGALLPQSALDIAPQGWINLHFSLLPAWRGAAPVQHSIWSGDEITGATTFRIVRELDAGPTFGVMTERVRATDTAGDLLNRLAEGGAQLLVRTLDGIETGELVAQPQPTEGVSSAPKILVEDAQVDWTQPAMAIDRRIRACTPAPGAWTWFEGERFKLGPVSLVDHESTAVRSLDPGVIEITKQAVYVGTGSAPLRLGGVQAVGKKQMPAADWARGARVESGMAFGDSR